MEVLAEITITYASNKAEFTSLSCAQYVLDTIADINRGDLMSIMNYTILSNNISSAVKFLKKVKSKSGA